MNAIVALSLALMPQHTGPDRPIGQPFATRSEVFATNGMAATSQPLATQTAIQILRAGGSAMDAAIAANAVLAVVEPTGSGIGGDLFAIVWDPETKALHGLNGSGRSPAGVTFEQLRAQLDELELDRIPSHGGLPVSVPGCVDGWFELHARFGKLPMERLLAPAIEYARVGFAVTPVIAHHWAANVRILARHESFVRQMTIGGRAPAAGEVFRNPNLGNLLEAIGLGGRDAFYTGDVAKRIADAVQAADGHLTADDLSAHTSEWVEPVSTSYRGHDVWELPPNGQGIAALQMLNILEGFDVAKLGYGSVEYLHALVEAKKLAFEDRARFYADPAFANVPVEGLLSKDYAAERRKSIDPQRAAQRVSPGDPILESGDTIYLATADANGMMVSLIQSNFRGMGSGVAPEGLGFVLQNRGELFHALDPEHPNAFAPAKRPFHTIIPAFVTKDGAPWLAFGVMGGAFQPQGHVQILCNLIDFGMNLQEAGDAARIEHGGSSQPTGMPQRSRGGSIALESGFPPDIAKKLESMGHVLRKRPGYFGGYQAILRHPDTGVYHGASESRKDGNAAGY